MSNTKMLTLWSPVFAVLLLVETALAQEPTPKVVNLCENGGFEVATTPDVPDCWGAYLQPKRTKNWYDRWVLDREVAFEGKASMRLEKKDQKEIVGLNYSGAINSWKRRRRRPHGIPIRPGSDYTLSLAMKSGEGTVKVGVNLHFIPQEFAGVKKKVGKRFEVGPEWKRYSLTGPAENCLHARLKISAPSPVGCVWIDAIQLEEGSVAHDYVPCANDMPAQERPAEPTGPPKLSIACDLIEKPPKVDGHLDDTCWKNTRWVDDFQIHPEGGKAIQQTEAAIVSDGKSLYIAFRCSTPDVKKTRTSSRAARDKIHWGSEDIVEVFLDTNGNRVSYLHFGVNADGVQYDASAKFYSDTPKPVVDVDWNGDWEVATGREKRAWTAEIAIPMATLSHWGIGEFSGIALCRENASARENSFWGGMFHRPATFARLTGTREKARRYAYSINGLVVQFRGLAEKTYCVTACIKNKTGQATSVRPSATLLFGDGKQLLAEGTLMHLNDGEQQLFRFGSLTFPPEVRECAMTISLLGEKGNLLAMTHNKSVPISLPLQIKPRLTFYTREKYAPIVVDLALPEETLKDVNIELNIPGQSANWARKKITGLRSLHSEHLLDIRRLPLGNHRIEAKLIGPGGNVAAMDSCQLRKLAPSPDEVRIDTVRRCLVVNGQDFLPYILTFTRIPEPRQRLQELVNEIRDENFNTLWATFNKSFVMSSDEKIRMFLDLAHEAGLRVAYWIAPLGRDEKTDKWGRQKGKVFYERVRHTISTFKDHPAILAWCLVDEPSKFHLEDDDPYWLGKMYKLATELDPYHPVYAEWRPNELQKQYQRSGGTLPLDIVSTHKYVIPVVGPAGILQRVDFMVQKRSEGRKPTWFFVQDWGGMGRSPSPEETTCMVYLALTHGMTGIGYWHGAWPVSRLVKTQMGTIGEEMEHLGPYLMIRDRQDRVTAKPVSIHALLRGEEKNTVLISVNAADEARHAILDLTEVRGGPFKRARVLFEDRKVKVRGGKIHDRFQPYERHVYLLQR